MEEIKIVRLERVEASESLERLFLELSGKAAAGSKTAEAAAQAGGKAAGGVPDVNRINSLIESRRLAFYGIMDSDRIVGMASVIPCRTAASDKLWIEDVCVLSERRGEGLGRALMEFAMSDSAELFGGGTFWLTSRPARAAARALYRSLGFSEYETGVFKREADATR